ALLNEMIDRGPENPQLTQPAGYAREDRYVLALRTLASALASLDRTRAYGRFASTFIATKDAALRGVLAHQMQHMERNYPELKKLPVTPPAAPDAKTEK